MRPKIIIKQTCTSYLLKQELKEGGGCTETHKKSCVLPKGVVINLVMFYIMKNS